MQTQTSSSSGDNNNNYLYLSSQLKCRLLYVNANTKTVGLSLQESVVQNKATSFGDFSVGDIIDDATVTRVDQGLGLLIKLSNSILGFTHVSWPSQARKN